MAHWPSGLSARHHSEETATKGLRRFMAHKDKAVDIRHDPAYEFVVGEPAAQNVQRVWQTTLLEAKTFLQARTDSGVHEARKRIKKLRAVLVLVASDIGREGKRLNAELRSAARSVGAVRDASSMIECAERIASSLERGEELREVLLKRREHIKSGTHEDVDEVAARVAVLQLALPLLRGDSFGPLEQGVRGAFERGCKCLAECESDSATAEEFHELRKATKTVWYLLCMLFVYWPPVLHPLKEEWKGVCDVLGHHHDLAVLREVVEHELLLHDEALHNFANVAASKLSEYEQDVLRTCRLLYAQGFHKTLTAAFELHE